MPKITQSDLAKMLPSGAPVSDPLPNWMAKTDEIVKGINELVKAYRQMTGKPDTTPVASGDNQSFLGAIAERKAQKGESNTTQKEVTVMPPSNEFKELLIGMIKTAQTLESIGHGERPLGEVLMSLPISVTTAREYLEKLLHDKYGG